MYFNNPEEAATIRDEEIGTRDNGSRDLMIQAFFKTIGWKNVSAIESAAQILDSSGGT